MINFRYHLVSIVAVLLALSVGIIVGSGLLGGPLLEDLENRAEQIRQTNQELRDLAEERLGAMADQERFAAEVELRLAQDVLAGAPVLLVDVEGTDGDVVGQARDSVALAGGRVTGTIHLREKFALRGEVERDLLALAVASTSGEPDEVRADAARRLGSRLATATAGSPARFDSLVTQLEDGDFLSVERPEEETELVPEGALLLVVAGSENEEPFDVGAFATELAATAADREVPVVVAEPLSSGWSVVADVRGESDVREQVTTVTGVDLVAGRVAAVLGLAAASEGDVGHFGLGAGADQILPAATSGD